MALPASGTLAMSTIASSVGTVAPNSMNELTRLTAVGSNASTFKTSNFYSWPDGGYKNGSPGILFDFGLNANYSNSGSTVSDRSGNGRNGTFVTGTGTGSYAEVMVCVHRLTNIERAVKIINKYVNTFKINIVFHNCLLTRRRNRWIYFL